MRRTQSLVPTLREAPADAVATSHRLLVRAGFVRRLGAGLYSLLPLGWRTLRRIEQIVRAEMTAVGAQELHLPAIHPAALWRESGRWDAMGAAMFRLRDRTGAEYALGMTHEEVVSALARETLRSYRDLPQTWFQFQTKFRDEERPRGGLLRTREFTMKDAYSFDMDRAGLELTFAAQRGAYERIFARCGVAAVAIDADSGDMGGEGSTEFMAATPAGEDVFVRCAACGFAANTELLARGAASGGSADRDVSDARCPRCDGALDRTRGLEVGHVFKLGTRYSAAMGVRVAGRDGATTVVQMGCYGIGLERVMAAVVEQHADGRGLRWPGSVAPFDAALVALHPDDAATSRAADELYRRLSAAGVAVLYDDRAERPGEKLAEADLIGLPVRLVVSRTTLARGRVEWHDRLAGTTLEIADADVVDAVVRARVS